jgi:hypothetical protein
MKLIMRSEFDNLQRNDDHSYTVDTNGDKEVLKLFSGETLIAKRIHMKNKKKKAKRYFGYPNYQNHLTADEKV